MLILGNPLWRTTGVGAPPTPPAPPPPPTEQPRGRVPWLGYTSPAPTEQERALRLRKDRERFGVIPEAAKIISEVALRQAQALERDEQKRFEELEREMALAGIEWETKYLELLNLQREQLIATEIGNRLQAMRQIEEETIALLMLSVLL